MGANVYPVPLSGIQETILAAKGDLIAASANDTASVLTAPSTNNYVLTSDSSTATGLKWAAASSGGPFRQLVNSATTSTQSISSTSYVDVTNLTVTITPASASNKVLIIMGSEVGLSVSGSDRCQTSYQLLRGSTVLTESTYQHIGDDNEVYESNYEGIVYVDSPNTTSAITYKIQGKVGNGSQVWEPTGSILALEITV